MSQRAILMPNKTPYELADRTITLLNKKAIQRFQKAKSECAALKFDELNVIQVMKRIYQDLKADNQKAFLDLAQLVYIDIYNSPAQEPDLSWLLALLDEYDPVTKYVYEHEVDRKREYATEAIIAAQSKAEQFRRALSYWSQFTAYYADEVEWRTTIKAFEDSGVKKVVWHTQEDEKVCEECGPRDGEVYPINNVPPRPHWGCRCWITEYKNDKKQSHSEEPSKKDVTREYQKQATPGKGKVTQEKDYSLKGHQAEVNMANLLLKVFGGKINLLKEANEDKVKTADYLWNGKLWDLKTVSTEKAADSAIRSGLKQIFSNPGGIILDYRGHEVSIGELDKVIYSRMGHSPLSELDVMVVLSGETVMVFRYKK